MAFELTAFISCPQRRLSTWRPEDLDAYKALRVLSGRRIAGSAWLPVGSGVVRVSNAHAHVLLSWFGDRAVGTLAPYRRREPRPVLLPVPGLNRIVGAPPSGSRVLAQELSARTGLRVLDVLRWRQRMPRCPPAGRQAALDHLIVTGSPVRGEAVLVADFVSSRALLEGMALRLGQMGCATVLALSAGVVTDSVGADPFGAHTERIELAPSLPR